MPLLFAKTSIVANPIVYVFCNREVKINSQYYYDTCNNNNNIDKNNNRNNGNKNNSKNKVVLLWNIIVLCYFGYLEIL